MSQLIQTRRYGLVALCSLAMVFSSCSQKEPLASTEEEQAAERLAIENEKSAVGPWVNVFSEYFASASTFSSQWVRTTGRYDYNSEGICYYNDYKSNLASRDGRTVLEINASKDGNIYRSGHVKSNFNYTVGNNEEYRVTATIKFVRLNGSTYQSFASIYGAWPAFWTVREQEWPTKGEIDIFEIYTKGTFAETKSNLFYGTTAGPNGNILGNNYERTYPSASSSTSGWHTYEMRFSNTNGYRQVTIYKDGAYVTAYNNGQGYGLNLNNFGIHNVILNLNVGDNGGIFNEGQINITSTNRAIMWVDNVYVDKRTL